MLCIMSHTLKEKIFLSHMWNPDLIKNYYLEYSKYQKTEGILGKMRRKVGGRMVAEELGCRDYARMRMSPTGIHIMQSLCKS